MKKTLVALIVAAVASSASALTVYEADGSKVDFEGSIRFRLEKNKTEANGSTEQRAHSNLHNDGTRFGVKVNHNISEDLYALGRLEFRFDGDAKTTDKFGDLYANKAFVGFGSKQFGELTFGRQATIGDDIAQSGFDNAYGVWDTQLTTGGKAVVRYDYKGIEGLQIGLGYRFAENRSKSGETYEKEMKDAIDKAQAHLDLVKALPQSTEKDTLLTKANEALTKAKADAGQGEIPVGKLKNGYDAGATYTFKVAEGQSATVAAGYSRDNFVTGNNRKHHKDAYAAGVSYSINDLTLAADYTGSFDKDGSKKGRVNAFSVGAKYMVTPAVAVYGNYAHGVDKTKEANVNKEKVEHNKFMLGSSYKVHKSVFTYVEGGIHERKKTDYAKNTKSTEKDKNIGVGLRIYW